jgi:hypothetical protein
MAGDGIGQTIPVYYVPDGIYLSIDRDSWRSTPLPPVSDPAG